MKACSYRKVEDHLAISRRYERCVIEHLPPLGERKKKTATAISYINWGWLHKHTGSSLQVSMRALYGFSPGLMITPERSSSLFFASVNSRTDAIVITRRLPEARFLQPDDEIKARGVAG
jgi:hypothetical protein